MKLNRENNTPSLEPIYEIRVEGQLSAEWSSWFEGLTIEQETNPGNGSVITVISGPVPDQPALHGILNKIRDLNLKLISVFMIDHLSPHFAEKVRLKTRVQPHTRKAGRIP